MNKRWLALSMLMAGLGLSAPALAHPEVSGQLSVHDGPLSIGVNLGHWLNHSRHYRPRGHVHGQSCYREYGREHRHWSSRYHRREHHDHDHGYGFQRNHRPHHRGRHHDRGSHHAVRQHRHSRDCHLHYPRGHKHWKGG